MTKKDENLIKIGYDRIIEANLDNESKENLISGLTALSNLLYKKEVINKMLSYEIVKETEIFKDYVKKVTPKIIDEARPKIINEAKPKIIELAKEEILLNQLNKKFNKLPESLVKEIKSLNSTAKIEKLLDSIFDFESPKDVSDMIKKMSKK